MHSSVSGIHGNLLEVTVVGCNKLKDTEWISRQDPYVCIEYGSSKSRTRTCTDGGKNPTFQEKFNFTLIEGLREINVMVWNSNTLKDDDFIGSGKIQLQKALSQGFDDSTWPIQSGRGRHTGEVRLIIHYPNFGKHGTTHTPSAPPYMHAPQNTGYGAPPVQTAHYPLAAPSYPSYLPNPSPYPPSPYYPAPPQAAAYPQPSAYPPQPAYPPQGYPPAAYPQQPYPPPPQAAPYYPPAPYPYPQPPRYW